MIKQCIRLATLIMAVIFNSSCEAGMVMTKEDVVLFSRVQGKLLSQGVPLIKTKMIRRYKYDTPQPIEDYCVTSDEGMFEFPAILRKNATVTPLVQFVVYQQIFVVQGGAEQQIWSHGKMMKNDNSEYGGDFKNISCDLSRDLERVKVGIVDFVYTNCVW